MTNLSHTAIRQAWTDRIKRFEQAGQTVAQFCNAEGVSTASFYQWRRRLRAEGSEIPQSLAQFVPVKMPTSQSVPPATVMSVELPGGVRVRFEVTSVGGTQ